MKKSEFDQQSSELWRLRDFGLTLHSYAEIRREAAEAAGVTWDPEDPVSLPDSLIVIKTGHGCGRLGYLAAGNAIADLTLEQLDEVKRRCDAWLELEELLEQQELCDWPGRLILGRILRGSPR